MFDEVHAFVKDSGLYEVQITYLTAFPGTPLHDRLEREGRILQPKAWELCTLFDINFRPRRYDASSSCRRDFSSWQRSCIRLEETAERRARFKRALRHSPNFGRAARHGQQRWRRERR